MKGKTIGFGITGSYCTFGRILSELTKLAEGNRVLPIFSYSIGQDTRFYKAADFEKEVTRITGNPPIKTITGAEPIGPQKLLDVMVIAPATGNTLAKLAYSISDTPVTMAAKAHLRNERPLVLAVSTNDALAGSAKNIGALLNYKNIYFVPMGQDDCKHKQRSMVADFSKLCDTAALALEGKQLQPILF